MYKSIAFLDFDGTLTKRDSFTFFILYVLSWPALLFKGLLFLPIAFLFSLGIVSNSKAKEWAVGFFFKGWKTTDLEAAGEQFASDRIPKLIRPGVLERIRWHQDQGHETVIVSASLRYWLRGFCRQYGLELICTELEESGDTITGKLNPRNCFGPEKVRKIRESYDLSAYDMIYAYGDTRGDREMLEMANQSFFKPFRGQDDFG